MTGWTAIVPIKPTHLGKSRLDVAASVRADLAEAFALDTLRALETCDLVGEIVVVTADVRLAGHAMPRSRTTVLADRPLLSGDGQNRAVQTALAWAKSRRAECPVIVVSSDLPCLTGPVLTDLLSASRSGSSFVADAEGVGTTMVLAPFPAALRTAFGPLSALRHARLGHQVLREVDPRARRDVDTIAHLSAAQLLGVGAATRHVLADAVVRRLPGTGRRSLTPSVEEGRAGCRPKGRAGLGVGGRA